MEGVRANYYLKERHCLGRSYFRTSSANVVVEASVGTEVRMPSEPILHSEEVHFSAKPELFIRLAESSTNMSPQKKTRTG